MLEASTFWELFDRRASEQPDAVMFTDENDRRITFGEFRDRAERVAAGLQSQFGVGPGSVVSWQLPTRIETVLVCTPTKGGLGLRKAFIQRQKAGK